MLGTHSKRFICWRGAKKMCSGGYIQANEIEVRPCKISEKTAHLLMYQDARRVQKVLDATYGPLNWQREYYEANSMLFCKIGVRNSETGEWIWKSDTGSSGGLEEEKSLASDAFKRAAVSWGIGRELYSIPSIRVELNPKDYYNDEFKQSFKVKDISIKDGLIMSLTIVDKWGNTRFTYDRDSSKTIVEKKDVKTKPSREEEFTAYCTKLKKEGVDTNELNRFYHYFMNRTAKDPDKKVLDEWKNPIPEKMWKWWISKPMAM